MPLHNEPNATYNSFLKLKGNYNSCNSIFILPLSEVERFQPGQKYHEKWQCFILLIIIAIFNLEM